MNDKEKIIQIILGAFSDYIYQDNALEDATKVFETLIYFNCKLELKDNEMILTFPDDPNKMSSALLYLYTECPCATNMLVLSEKSIMLEW